MFFNYCLKKLNKTCVAVFLLTQSVASYAEINSYSNDVDVKKDSVNFPQWPKRASVNKEIIPPPPPGPYMSSALSDYSVKGPSFGRSVDRPEIGVDGSNVSIDTFDPDIPWPDNLREKPNRWMPDKGYSFVKPMRKAEGYAMPPNNSSGYSYEPNTNNTRPQITPAMRVVPNQANRSTQLYPAVGNYSSGYQNHINNNFYGQPMNRTAYPESNKRRYSN